MKHFITLSFIILCANIMVGQSKKKASDQLKMHQQFLNGLLQKSNQKTASRTTESWTSERVIAQCTRDTSGARTDSVKLTYGINDTSTYDYNMMQYAYNYPYATSPLFNYMGIYTRPQVLSRTYSHWTINPNTLVYGFYQKDAAGYDSRNNLVNDSIIFADSTINPNMIYSNKFNAFNSIDTSYSFLYSSGIANNAFKQFFDYDVSDKLVKDSIYEYVSGAWHLVSKTFYTYDVSNNLVQIDNYANNSDVTFTLPLVEQLQYINTYDVDNRMLTTLTSYYDGTSLSNYVKDTFAYTGTHPFHTSWKEYQYDVINAYWAPIINMNKHLNGDGLPDIVDIQSFDSLSNAWVPSAREIIKYNGFNNPDTLLDYEYDYTSFPVMPSFTTVYYYESFTNSTSVTDIVSDKNINLYPNPTADIITLSGLKSIPTDAVLTLYDVEGRIQKKQKLLPGIDLAEVSLSALKPGIYFMVINDNIGNMLFQNKLVVNR